MKGNELVLLDELMVPDLSGMNGGSEVYGSLVLNGYLFFGTIDPGKLFKYIIDENGCFELVDSIGFPSGVYEMCKFGNDLLLRIGFYEIRLYDTSSGKHRLLFKTKSSVLSLTSFNDSIFVGTFVDHSVHRYSSSGNLESSFKCGLLPYRIFVKEVCLIVSRWCPWKSEIYSHDNSLLKKFDDELILPLDSHYLYLTSKEDFIIRLNEDAYGEIGRVDLGDNVRFIAQLEEGVLIVRCDNSIHRIRFDESRIEIVDRSGSQPGFYLDNSLNIIKHASGGCLVIESYRYGIRSLAFSKSMEFNGDVPFASSLICNKVLPPPSDIKNVYSLELHQIDDFTCLSMALFLRRLDVRNNGLNKRQMGSLCKSIMSLPNLKELLVEGNDFSGSLVDLKRLKKSNLELDIQIVTSNYITKKDANENLVRLKNNLLVVLLGHSGAGKTVLSECIKTGKLRAPGTHESTSTVQCPISQPISKLFGKNIPAVWDFPGQIQSFITNRVFLSNPFFVPVLVSDLSLDYDELLACQSFWVRLLACASEGQFQTANDDEKEGTKSMDKNLLNVPKIILVGTHMDLCKENAMEKMKRLKKDLEEFCALHHHHLEFHNELFPVCSVSVGSRLVGDRLDDVKKYLSVTAVQETRLPVELKKAQYRFRRRVEGTGLILSLKEFASRIFTKEVDPELLKDALQFLTATVDIIFSENDLDDRVVINPIKFGEIVSLFVAPIETRCDESLVFAQHVRDNDGEVKDLSIYGDLLHSISIDGIAEEGMGSEEADEIRKEALGAAEKMVEKMGIIYIKNKPSDEFPEGKNVIVCPALVGEPNSSKFSLELDQFCFQKLGLQRFVFGQCVSSGKRLLRTVKEKKGGERSISGRALDAAKLKKDSSGAICYPPGRFEEFVKSVVSDDSRMFRNVVFFYENDCVVLLQLESFFMRHIYVICYSKSLEKATEETNRLRRKLESICGEKNVFSGCICPTCIDIAPLQSSDSFKQRCCNFDNNLELPKRCSYIGQDVIPLTSQSFEGNNHGTRELLKTTLAVTSLANSMVNLCNNSCKLIGIVRPVLDAVPSVSPVLTVVGQFIDATNTKAANVMELLNQACKNDQEMEELKCLVAIIREYLNTSKDDMEGYLDEGHIVSRGYIQSLHYLHLHLTEVYELIRRYGGESRISGKTWMQLIKDGEFKKAFGKKTWAVGFRIFGCEFFDSEMKRLCAILKSSTIIFSALATRKGLEVIKMKFIALEKETYRVLDSKGQLSEKLEEKRVRPMQEVFKELEFVESSETGKSFDFVDSTSSKATIDFKKSGVIVDNQNVGTSCKGIVREIKFLNNDLLGDLALLGKGATSEVYSLKGQFKGKCVKLMKKGKDHSVKKKFMEEAEIHSKLDHRSIVIYDAIVENETHFGIILEEMQGSMDDISIETYSDAIRVRCAYDLALAIEYLNDLNILHSDLKPENVYVSWVPKIVVKLGDFGASVQLGEDSDLVSVKGYTIQYASPEHFEDEISKKSDVFSFGSLLYYISTGRHPFGKGKEGDALSAIINGNMPSLDDITINGMSKLIEDCWRIDPDERPTMSEVVTRLSSMVSAYKEAELSRLPAHSMAFIFQQLIAMKQVYGRRKENHKFIEPFFNRIDSVLRFEKSEKTVDGPLLSSLLMLNAKINNYRKRVEMAQDAGESIDSVLKSESHVKWFKTLDDKFQRFIECLGIEGIVQLKEEVSDQGNTLEEVNRKLTQQNQIGIGVEKGNEKLDEIAQGLRYVTQVVDRLASKDEKVQNP